MDINVNHFPKGTPANLSRPGSPPMQQACVHFIDDRTGRRVVMLGEEFSTRDDALEYLHSHREEIEALLRQRADDRVPSDWRESVR